MVDIRLRLLSTAHGSVRSKLRCGSPIGQAERQPPLALDRNLRQSDQSPPKDLADHTKGRVGGGTQGKCAVAVRPGSRGAVHNLVTGSTPSGRGSDTPRSHSRHRRADTEGGGRRSAQIATGPSPGPMPASSSISRMPRRPAVAQSQYEGAEGGAEGADVHSVNSPVSAPATQTCNGSSGPCHRSR